MRPPSPPPLPLSFGFSAQQPPSPSPTSLSPWCPRVWRWQSPEFGPRGELPSPPLSLSLSLSLLFPSRFSLPACALPAGVALAAWLPGGAVAARVRPAWIRRGRAAPTSAPRRVASAPCASVAPPARGLGPLRGRGSPRRHGPGPGAWPRPPCARPSWPRCAASDPRIS
jgi:hypothetical protein